MKSTILMICLCISPIFLLSFDGLSVRLLPTNFEEKTSTLTVHVQLQNNGSHDLSLAGQNYRFYYDTESLSLRPEDSHSDLSSAVYSELQFTDIIEGANVQGVDQLPFDDNLGFVNFDINMKDLTKAGASIPANSQWHNVAVLQFEVTSSRSPAEMIWSEKGRTDDYATAFVAISRWVAPNQIQPVKVDAHVGGKFSIEDAQKQEIKVYPNPAIDVTTITLKSPLKTDTQLHIIDLSGKSVLQHHIVKGEQFIQLSVDHLAPGEYIIEMRDNKGLLHHKKSKLLKIK